MTQPMDSSDAPAVPVEATEGWVAINLARAASPAALKSLERRLTQVSVLLSASASNTARGQQVSTAGVSRQTAALKPYQLEVQRL